MLKFRLDKANYGFIMISLVEANSTQNTNAFLEHTVHIKIQKHLVYTTISSLGGVRTSLLLLGIIKGRMC